MQVFSVKHKAQLVFLCVSMKIAAVGFKSFHQSSFSSMDFIMNISIKAGLLKSCLQCHCVKKKSAIFLPFPSHVAFQAPSKFAFLYFCIVFFQACGHWEKGQCKEIFLQL